MSKCETGSSTILGVDSVIGSCAFPVEGMSYTTSICTAGSTSTEGANTILSTCSAPQAGQVVLASCLPGSSSATGVDTHIAACTTPSNWSFVASVCIRGSTSAAGLNSVIEPCKVPTPYQYVTAVCQMGSITELGSNTSVKQCSSPATGEYVKYQCVQGTPSSTGADTQIQQCSTVPIGHYTISICSPGSYNEDGKDTVFAECPEGFSCTGGVKSPCEIGFTSGKRASSCYPLATTVVSTSTSALVTTTTTAAPVAETSTIATTLSTIATTTSRVESTTPSTRTRFITSNVPASNECDSITANLYFVGKDMGVSSILQSFFPSGNKDSTAFIAFDESTVSMSSFSVAVLLQGQQQDYSSNVLKSGGVSVSFVVRDAASGAAVTSVTSEAPYYLSTSNDVTRRFQGSALDSRALTLDPCVKYELQIVPSVSSSTVTCKSIHKTFMLTNGSQCRSDTVANAGQAEGSGKSINGGEGDSTAAGAFFSDLTTGKVSVIAAVAFIAVFIVAAGIFTYKYLRRRRKSKERADDRFSLYHNNANSIIIPSRRMEHSHASSPSSSPGRRSSLRRSSVRGTPSLPIPEPPPKNEWRIAYDEEGDPYYYNEFTGESSWYLPDGHIFVDDRIPTDQDAMAMEAVEEEYANAIAAASIRADPSFHDEDNGAVVVQVSSDVPRKVNRRGMPAPPVAMKARSPVISTQDNEVPLSPGRGGAKPSRKALPVPPLSPKATTVPTFGQQLPAPVPSSNPLSPRHRKSLSAPLDSDYTTMED